MFITTNILTCRFAKCSVDVKIILFRAYCICLYDAGLWSRHKAGSFNKLLSCYNKCLKCFSGSNAQTAWHRFCLIWVCVALIQLCIIARLFLVKVSVVAPILLSGILIVYCRLYADCFMIVLSVSVSVSFYLSSVKAYTVVYLGLVAWIKTDATCVIVPIVVVVVHLSACSFVCLIYGPRCLK